MNLIMDEMYEFSKRRVDGLLRKNHIDLCIYYTTTGYPNFKPKCEVKLKAGLKCHKWNCNCPEYRATDSGGVNENRRQK